MAESKLLKAIPIFISLAAVAISCLSWWESHQVRLLNERVKLANEEVNRPVFTFISIEAENRGGKVVVFVTLKNTGKVTANVDKFEYSAAFETGKVCDPKSEKVWNFLAIPTIEPGTEETFINEEYTLTPECKKLSTLSPTIFISIQYTDTSSGKQYSQSFVRTVDLLTKKKNV